MVYGKKTYTKRRMSSKKPFKRSTTTFAKKVKAVIKKTSETKNYIYSIEENSMSSLTSPLAATVWTLNTIPQGTGQASRNGNKIEPKYLDVRGSVHLEPTGVTQYVRRLILECQATDDCYSDLTEVNSGANSPAGLNISAMYARINTTTYRVLGERVIKVGISTGYYSSQLFHFKCKLAGNMYFETGVNVPNKRAIKMVAFNRLSNSDETTGATAEISFSSKFYYNDS